MTSPFDSSSTTTNAKQQPAAAPEKLLLHTMRGDLEALQKKALLQSAPPPSLEKVSLPKEKVVANNVPIPVKTSFDSKAMPVSANVQTGKPATPTPAAFIQNIPDPADQKSSASSSTAYKITLAIVAVLIVGIIGLGGYYFLITRQAQPIVSRPVVTTPPVAETPAITEPAPDANTPVEKYSQEKPNYLSLDLTTLSADEIKTSIASVAAELKTKNSSTAYEFVVVDANNNPVAFPIFATAAKLNLSPTLLSSLGENFSLFLYNDNDNMRLSIAVDITKKTTATTELTKQEKTFVTDGAFLFLNAQPEIKTGAFAVSESNLYHGYTIRYINVDAQKTLSIDYAVTESQLVIATSKNTMKAVIDKLSTVAASVATPAPTTPDLPPAPATLPPATTMPNPTAQQLPPAPLPPTLPAP